MESGYYEQGQLSDKMVQQNLPPGVRLVHTLRGHAGWIGRIAWSPNGECLASASEDRTIRLWNAENGNAIDSFQGHEDWVYAVAWSNDGQRIASTSADGTVRIWKTKKDMGDDIPRILRGHNSSVFAVSWHPSGQLIASGSRDGTVIFWVLSNDKIEISLILNYKYWINSLDFSPDGHYIASGTGEGVIHIFDVNRMEPSKVLRGHCSHIVCVAWSPDGKTIASASSDNQIRIWNAENGCNIEVLKEHTDSVRYVSYSASGELLASKSDDGTIRIWRTSDWRTISVIQEPCSSDQIVPEHSYRDATSNWLSGLAFHPRLTRLATVGSDIDRPEVEREKIIHIYELDLHLLLSQLKDRLEEPSMISNEEKLEDSDHGLNQLKSEPLVSSPLQEPKNHESLIEPPKPDVFPAKSIVNRTKVFISYSRKDKKIFDEFKTMLAPAIQKGLLELWDDTMIEPGTMWRDEIKGGIAAAKVAVLLVSPYFLASDFIVKNELPPLLKAAQDEGAAIFWVYLGECLYKKTEIEKYQAVHDIRRPLYKLNKPERMEVIAKICEKLLRII